VTAGPLAGQGAVVTGASRGIGLATTRLLAAAGARVVMLARGAGALRAAAAEVGPAALPVPCDVGDGAAVERAIAAIPELLGAVPDIVVSNAGLFPLAPIERTTSDEFARALDVNLVAPFRFARAFLSAMRERGGGHVVTIGSVADRTTFAGNAAYAAGKFGARALHQVLREETRGSGVRATLVSPGPVDTPLWDPLDPDSRPDLPPRSAMLSPEDVAEAVLWAVTRPRRANVDELRLSRS
jgi:NADP-dependent 3-hydroxy acid dehydrogenase YdfG